MKVQQAFRSGHIVVAIVLALVVLVVLSKTYLVWRAHGDALARAERDTRNASAVLAEHASRTLDGVARALGAVADLRADVEAGRVSDPSAVHDALRAIHGASPVILGVGWTDAGGNRLTSSLFRDPPPLNIADQEPFRFHVTHPDAGLHVSTPFRSRIDGTWIMPVSRRLVDTDGQFAGIANAILRLDYFIDFYRAINLGPGTEVILARSDGIVLLRVPMVVDWIGRSLLGSMMFRGQTIGPVPENLATTSPTDGRDRILAYRATSEFPLVIAATMLRMDAFAPFRDELLWALVEGSLMIGALLAGGWIIATVVRRRAAAARELAETGALLESVFAVTNQAIIVFDPDRRAVAWNERCADYFGEALKLGKGAPLHEMLRVLAVNGEYGSRDVDASVAERLAAAQAGKAVRYERQRPNGMTIEVSWLPLPNGFLAIAHSDITHLKRAEKSLRESEALAARTLARLKDAVDSLADPFFLWDAEERLVVANRTAVGGPGGDALVPGITLADAIAIRVRSGRFAAAAGREEAYIQERLDQIRRADGNVVEIQLVDGTWLATWDRRTQEGGIVSLRVDITKAKLREAELAAARLTADAASRAKSDFLSRMSHELRTPLNAVIGFSQMLQIDRVGTMTDRQRSYCRDIEEGGRHLLALVDDVLDLARIESGKDRMSLERVAASDALESLKRAMTVIAERSGIALRVADPIGVPDCRADDMRLHQVLLNLVSNAIKYNRSGGSVDVSAEAMPGDKVRFVVADTGIGISEAAQKEMFEPFHRFGQEFSGIDGTGIGLAICRRLAEAMGGSIGFTSAVGAGSTFWIEMPADRSALPALAAAADAGADAASMPEVPPVGGSILYIEDNPSNMRLMELMVSVLPGVALLTATTPRLGLDLARTHRPDLILLDLHLPGMNGYEALAHLKAMPETASIPVIALTAAAMPSDVRRGLAAGFFRYLTKPIDVKELLSAIGECLPSAGRNDIAI